MDGHRARKRFGQNFLVDGNIIRKIVAALDPKPDQVIVEIGPGLGAMTRPVSEKLDRLHVVEIDRDLAQRLREGDLAPRLEIHETDALKFDFGTLGPDLRVIGNLPYNISSPLLFHLADHAEVLPAGQHHAPPPGIDIACPVSHREPVRLAAQMEVEQDYVWPFIPDERQSRGAVDRAPDDLEAVLVVEDARQQVTHEGLVFDDENPCRRLSQRSSPGSGVPSP